LPTRRRHWSGRRDDLYATTATRAGCARRNAAAQDTAATETPINRPPAPTQSSSNTPGRNVCLLELVAPQPLSPIIIYYVRLSRIPLLHSRVQFMIIMTPPPELRKLSSIAADADIVRRICFTSRVAADRRCVRSEIGRRRVTTADQARRCRLVFLHPRGQTGWSILIATGTCCSPPTARHRCA
jgi:hypothetical protein